jgi:hypothetical protein
MDKKLSKKRVINMNKKPERRRRVQQIITERLTWLMNRNGKLTPRAVVADAQKPSSPLHRHGGFQWDVHKAAYRHWLDRARTMIASVEIIYTVDHRTITVPYFTRDPRLPSREQGYCTFDELKDNSVLASETIDSQLVVALGVLHRVLSMAKVLGLEGRVMQAIVGLRDLRKRVRTTPRKRPTAVRRLAKQKTGQRRA